MFSKRSTRADAAIFRLIRAVLVLLMLAAPAAAQDEAPPWETWDRQAASAREVIDAGAASEEALSRLRERLETQRDAAAKVSADAGEKLKRLEGELEALGPAPEEGVEEAPEAAALRKEITDALAAAKADQGRADRAVARAETLLSDLVALGQRRFIDKLERRGPSPVFPETWVKANDALWEIKARIEREVDRALAAPADREYFSDRAPLALIAIGAGVFVLFGLRGLAVGLLMREAGRDRGRGRRLMLGVGATAARMLTAAVAAGLLLFGIGAAGVLGLVGDAVVQGLGKGLFVLIIAYGLAAALFSPQASALRLSNLSNEEARLAFRQTMWLAGALALHSLLNSASHGAGVSAEAEGVFALVTVGAAALALYRLAHTLKPTLESETEGALTAQAARLLRRIALAAAFVAPVLALLGYAYAAKFLLFPTVRSLAVIAAGYMIFALIREAVDVYLEGSDEDTVGRRLRLAPILAGFLLICAAIPLLALIWGADVADLSAAYAVAAAGLSVGEVVISPMDFVVFALVFAIGYTVTRMAQRVLSGTVLPQTGMSAGGASALTAGVGYVGVFIAAIAAITATGLDLSNLAIVAGALSVGVGFGLQNIVNNFVSGVILLVERPIKAGDWIEAGGQAGYVKQVNVRSTEIETFDRASFIIPNSDLIAGSVINWTHSDMTGRVRVPVGVAYGTDPRKVEEILMEIGHAHPMVHDDPSPVVYFMNFGADALEFELRVYLKDVNWMLTVKSDLNYAIAERFHEEGIEIPFAQRDLHIRDPEALGRALRGD